VYHFNRGDCDWRDVCSSRKTIYHNRDWYDVCTLGANLLVPYDIASPLIINHPTHTSSCNVIYGFQELQLPSFELFYDVPITMLLLTMHKVPVYKVTVLPLFILQKSKLFQGFLWWHLFKNGQRNVTTPSILMCHFVILSPPRVSRIIWMCHFVTLHPHP
jgi:hypothetical protein